MAVVDSVDVKFTANPFSGGLIKNLVTDPQSSGAGRIAGEPPRDCRRLI
jgi:hypothetical protein